MTPCPSGITSYFVPKDVYSGLDIDPEVTIQTVNLIAQNLPAHVLPEFYWLDFAFFAQFEMRYLQWLGHLQTSSLAGFSGELKALDESAQHLIAFLQKNRPQHELHYWI